MPSSLKCLPLFARGKVVKGFGRGSKELGIPTANLDQETVDSLPPEMSPGIYFGLASVEGAAAVHQMVMSVGWNPFYKNEKKSMEAHLIHEFAADFYGASLSLVVVDFIRPERNFDSLDDLISAINADIETAKTRLSDPVCAPLFKHSFWAQKGEEEEEEDGGKREQVENEGKRGTEDNEGSGVEAPLTNKGND